MLARGRDGRGQPLWIDVEGVSLDIHEDRRGAGQGHHFGRGAEGERRADDGVAGTNALGAQRQRQCVGAAGAGDGMLGAAECGELALEGAHLRTEHELAMIEHARDRGVDGGAETAALGRNVDEWNRRRFDTLVHDFLFPAAAVQPATTRGAWRGAASRWVARASRQRVAISRLATPSSPVTAARPPERTACKKASSSERNGSA